MAEKKGVGHAYNVDFLKAVFDQDRYDFEASRVAGSSSAAKKDQIQADEARRLAEINQTVERLTAQRKAITAELGQYTGQAATVQKQMEDMTAEQSRLQK